MAFFNTDKLRDKLLTYTFSHSDEEWYIRQLAALVLGDPGNVSREIRQMEKEGLFLAKKKGNMKLVGLNPRYPLFQEMKTMIFKTKGVEGALRTLVADHKGLTRAFIYGSYAKGKETATSDIDLLVVGTLVEETWMREIHELEKRLNREINYTHFSEREYAAKAKETGGFLALVLKGKIIRLKGSVHD